MTGDPNRSGGAPSPPAARRRREGRPSVSVAAIAGAAHGRAGARPLRPWLELLPLTFLAVMLAIAIGIERVRFDTLLWQSKLPLAGLLVLAFARHRRR